MYRVTLKRDYFEANFKFEDPVEAVEFMNRAYAAQTEDDLEISMKIVPEGGNPSTAQTNDQDDCNTEGW